jgi:predicted AAA+ superfamily ATPase
MTDLDAKTLLDGNDLSEEFKGALTEQYVLQQLLVSKETGIFYWSPENARAEVDFLLQIDGKIVPVEVKAAENLHAIPHFSHRPTEIDGEFALSFLRHGANNLFLFPLILWI